MAAIALAALCAAPQPSRADSSRVLTAKLPSPRYGTSAVWTGTHVYVFGGVQSVPSNQIVRYDPASGAVTVMAATLPTARWSTSAVYDGSQYVYVFGGSRVPQGSVLNEILRFDTVAGTIETLPATLPTVRWGTSAVWAGGVAYVFGGNEGAAWRQEIVRFDPAAGTAVAVGQLPTARAGTSAVWAGGDAYIFGGDQPGSVLRDIVRYRPSTGEVTKLGQQLPVAARYTSAVWDGVNAFVLGGGSAPGALLSSVVRFTPSTGVVATMAGTLPSQREYTSAVWDGAGALVLGGAAPGGVLDHIVRYTLEPGAPTGLTAIRGPGRGQITLNWYAPSDAGAIGGYRIYGGSAPGQRSFLAQTGAATSWTDSALADGETRYYAVRAFNDFGESPPSAEAHNAAPVRPGAPRELRALPDGIGSVALTWRAPLTFGGVPVAGYNVYRSTGSGGPAIFVKFSPYPNATDFGCRFATLCSYVVKAVNVVGEGPASNEATAIAIALS